MDHPPAPRPLPWIPVARNLGVLWVLVLTVFLALPLLQAATAARPVFDQAALVAEFRASLTLAVALAALASAPVIMATWAWERRARPARAAVPGACRACGAEVTHCPSCGKPLTA